MTQAQSALDGKKCSAANAALTSFTNTVDGLSGVNGTVTAALNDGAQKLSSLLSRECKTQTTSTKTGTVPAHTQTHTATRAHTTPTHTQTHPVITQPHTTTGAHTQPQRTTPGGVTKPGGTPTTGGTGGGGL